MRVLHLLDHSAPRRSDYSRRTQALLQGLRSHGVHTVHLTGPGHAAGGPAAAITAAAADGWHFYRTALPAGMERLARQAPRLGAAARTAALALRLRQVARLTRPDLIHVHLPSWNALAALPVAHLARLPLVVEADRRAGASEPPPPALQAWLERRALDRAHAIAAGTAQVRASLRADGVGGKRITVIPPAPDLPACRSASAIRTGLGPPGLEGAPLLAYAGGTGALDGLELLLAAFAVLRRTFPALRLVVAGSDDELAEGGGVPGMRGHVVFTGALSYRRAADLLPRADIAVFPTLHAAGVLSPSRHLLNAMAQGCAIVASDIPCHRELLVHGHSGILFQAGSRNVLAEAIAALLGAPWRLAALGAAAADFIGGRRSWDMTARRYRRLYETVLAQSGKRR